MDGTPAPRRNLTYEVAGMNQRERLRELILYISACSAYDRGFGVTKLNKLLWWADTYAFGVSGRPITGCAYVRLPQGPVPDGIDTLRDEMVVRGELAISPVETYGRTRHRPVPLRRHNLSAFTGEEISVIDAIIRQHDGQTASGVSKRSHGRMWDAISQGERMPYESVFISDAKPTRYDMARTRELSRQFGWV